MDISRFGNRNIVEVSVINKSQLMSRKNRDVEPEYADFEEDVDSKDFYFKIFKMKLKNSVG